MNPAWSFATHDGLAEPLARTPRANVDRLVARRERRRSAPAAHHRRRVEEVHADDPVRPAGRGAELDDRDRRGVRGEHGLGLRELVELAGRSRAWPRGPRSPPRSPGRRRRARAGRGRRDPPERRVALVGLELAPVHARVESTPRSARGRRPRGRRSPRRTTTREPGAGGDLDDARAHEAAAHDPHASARPSRPRISSLRRSLSAPSLRNHVADVLHGDALFSARLPDVRCRGRPTLGAMSGSHPRRVTARWASRAWLAARALARLRARHVPTRTARAELLHATGHGYLPYATQVALLAGATGLVGAVPRVGCHAAGDHVGSFAADVVRLAAVQAGAFLAMEVGRAPAHGRLAARPHARATARDRARRADRARRRGRLRSAHRARAAAVDPRLAPIAGPCPVPWSSRSIASSGAPRRPCVDARPHRGSPLLP